MYCFCLLFFGSLFLILISTANVLYIFFHVHVHDVHAHVTLHFISALKNSLFSTSQPHRKDKGLFMVPVYVHVYTCTCTCIVHALNTHIHVLMMSENMKITRLSVPFSRVMCECALVPTQTQMATHMFMLVGYLLIN